MVIKLDRRHISDRGAVSHDPGGWLEKGPWKDGPGTMNNEPDPQGTNMGWLRANGLASGPQGEGAYRQTVGVSDPRYLGGQACHSEKVGMAPELGRCFLYCLECPASAFKARK